MSVFHSVILSFIPLKFSSTAKGTRQRAETLVHKISDSLLFPIISFVVSKTQAWAHHFNAKIGSEKFTQGQKILTKKKEFLDALFREPNFYTILVAFQDLVHIFNFKIFIGPGSSWVILNSKNPKIGIKNIFLVKGSRFVFLFWLGKSC